MNCFFAAFDGLAMLFAKPCAKVLHGNDAEANAITVVKERRMTDQRTAWGWGLSSVDAAGNTLTYGTRN